MVINCRWYIEIYSTVTCGIETLNTEGGRIHSKMRAATTLHLVTQSTYTNKKNRKTVKTILAWPVKHQPVLANDNGIMNRVSMEKYYRFIMKRWNLQLIKLDRLW